MNRHAFVSVGTVTPAPVRISIGRHSGRRRRAVPTTLALEEGDQVALAYSDGPHASQVQCRQPPVPDHPPDLALAQSRPCSYISNGQQRVDLWVYALMGPCVYHRDPTCLKGTGQLKYLAT